MNDYIYELEVNNLSINFSMYEKYLRKKIFTPISNLSIKAKKGEIITIVGASGSGKSLLAHAIMGILPKNAIVTGDIKYKGKIINDRIKNLRGKHICFIPQSVNYFNPLVKIGNQIVIDNSEKSKIVMKNSLKKYDLPEKIKNLYPFECSGGMIRKALISTVDQVEPTVIIADEPTPGLGISMASNILKYFRNFANNGKAVIIITHDIDIAVKYSDKIAVFYNGTILEITNAKNFIKGEEYLHHPYTKGLYNALPQNGFKVDKNILDYNTNIECCVYFNNCNKANELCKKNIPLRLINDDEFVRCIYDT